MGRDVQSTLDIVFAAFPPPTAALPTLRGAVKDGFGKTVTRDMLEACECPSPDSRQKGLLWVNKKPNLGLHPVFGLVLPIRNMEFSQAIGLKSLDPFSESASRVRVSRSWRGMEMTGD